MKIKNRSAKNKNEIAKSVPTTPPPGGTKIFYQKEPRELGKKNSPQARARERGV